MVSKSYSEFGGMPFLTHPIFGVAVGKNLEDILFLDSYYDVLGEDDAEYGWFVEMFAEHSNVEVVRGKDNIPYMVSDACNVYPGTVYLRLHDMSGEVRWLTLTDDAGFAIYPLAAHYDQFLSMYYGEAVV